MRSKQKVIELGVLKKKVAVSDELVAEAERLRMQHKRQLEAGKIDQDFLEFANSYSDEAKYNEAFDFAYDANHSNKGKHLKLKKSFGGHEE